MLFSAIWLHFGYLQKILYFICFYRQNTEFLPNPIINTFIVAIQGAKDSHFYLKFVKT